jgi:hypothetical protein
MPPRLAPRRPSALSILPRISILLASEASHDVNDACSLLSPRPTMQMRPRKASCEPAARQRLSLAGATTRPSTVHSTHGCLYRRRMAPGTPVATPGELGAVGPRRWHTSREDCSVHCAAEHRRLGSAVRTTIPPLDGWTRTGRACAGVTRRHVRQMLRATSLSLCSPRNPRRRRHAARGPMTRPA